MPYVPRSVLDVFPYNHYKFDYNINSWSKSDERKIYKLSIHKAKETKRSSTSNLLCYRTMQISIIKAFKYPHYEWRVKKILKVVAKYHQKGRPALSKKEKKSMKL